MTSSDQRKFSNQSVAISTCGLCFFVLFVGYAASVAFTKTSTLTWPYDPDHFRDIAATETILQRGLGSDPYYRDEGWWYNPGLPALMALIASTSGIDVPQLYARAGTFLNILAPLAFYALVRRTSGSFVAAASLLAYLYVTPRGTQAWQTATYSPWLFAGTFAQPLFYSTLMAIAVLWRDAAMKHRLLVGFGLGMTLLVHTGPALLLVGILACEAIVRASRSERVSTTVRRIGLDAVVIGLPALLIAAPLVVPLVVRYKLQVVNWYPAEWSYELLDLDRIADLARTHATPATFLALIGTWRLRRDMRESAAPRPLAFWATANVALLLIGYVRQIAPAFAGVLPSLVPQFHFLSYFRALLAVLAGYGLLAIAEWIRQALAGRSPAPRRLPSTHVIGFCLLSIAAVAAMPRFGRRDDFGQPVAESMKLAAEADRVAAYRWARTSVDVDDVVLAPDDLAQTIIGAAGKRVVVVDRYFSNPYVAHQPRAEARDAMYRAIEADDQEAFCAQAGPYGVSWVAARLAETARPAAPAWVQPGFVSESIVISRVACAPQAAH